MTPGTDRATSLIQIRTLKCLAPYVRTRAKIVAGALAAVLGGTLVELLKPWPLKFVFDYLLKDLSFIPPWALPSGGDARTWLLAFICGLILFIWALSSLSAYFKDTCCTASPKSWSLSCGRRCSLTFSGFHSAFTTAAGSAM